MQASPALNLFRDLSSKVERLWLEQQGSYEVFPQLATRALQDFNYDWTQDRLDQEIARWLLESDKLPDQINVHNTFGQPPLTVFNNGRFVVDLYIWLNFDTSLHSHGFRGAFRVLHGLSLQEEFNTEVKEQAAPDIMFTDLGRPEIAVLKPGDVRTIWPGRDLTHRVIHLEAPTVTLCVKTINEPDLHQWNYFANGLAIQKRQLSAALFKAVYYFQYLLLQNEDEAAGFLDQWLGKLDISLQMNLYEEIAAGGLDLGEETTHVILESILARHEDSPWLKQYQSASHAALTELDFAACASAVGRLLGHVISSGYSLNQVRETINEVAGSPLSQQDIEQEVLALARTPNLFHIDFDEEEIQQIQQAIIARSEPIPSHLPAAQIEMIRTFLFGKAD